MTNAIGHSAMILAAGLGQRMRPLTLTKPKPLVEVGGKPLIGFAFDALRSAQVRRAVVNVHHLAEQIEDWCSLVDFPAVIISDERGGLLETGGGVLKALPHFGPEPFFVLNGDGFWLETAVPALQRLKDSWRDETMDCLLLLSPVARTTGYDGRGDFAMDRDGRLSRGAGQAGALAYIGGYLVHPRLFDGTSPGRFSMNVLWDKAIAQGRLFGLVHDGHWLHVGTPDAIAQAEAHMR